MGFGHDAHGPRIAILLHESRRNILDIPLRLFFADARLQAPDQANAKLSGAILGAEEVWLEREWHPQIGHFGKRRSIERKAERGRHHSDYRERFFIELYCLPQNVGIAAVLVLPKCVRENDDATRTVPVFFRCEAAPQLWRDSEQRKCRSRQSGRVHAQRLTSARKIEARTLIRRNLRERAIAVSIILILPCRDSDFVR